MTEKDRSSSQSLKEALSERLRQAKESVLNEIPADYLIHRRIVLKPHHVPTGKTRHTIGVLSDDKGIIPGPELPAPHELIIAQLPSDPGYYLLYLDERGNEINDTYHESLEKALDQAKWEFNVEFDEWQTT